MLMLNPLTSIVVYIILASYAKIECEAEFSSPEIVSWPQTPRANKTSNSGQQTSNNSNSNYNHNQNSAPGDEQNMVNLVNEFWEENKLQLHSDDFMQVDSGVQTSMSTNQINSENNGPLVVSSQNPRHLDLLKMATPTLDEQQQLTNPKVASSFELVDEASLPSDNDEQNTDDGLIKYDNMVANNNNNNNDQLEPIYSLLKAGRNLLGNQSSEGSQIESPYMGSNSTIEMSDIDGDSSKSTTTATNPAASNQSNATSQRSSNGGSNLIARALNNINLASQKFSRPPYASNHGIGYYDNSVHDRTNQLYTTNKQADFNNQPAASNNQSKPIFDERIDLLEEPANRFEGSINSAANAMGMPDKTSNSLQPQPVANHSDPKVVQASALPELALQDLNKRSDPQGFELNSNTNNKPADGRGAQLAAESEHSKPKRFDKFAIHSIDLNPIPIMQANNSNSNSNEFLDLRDTRNKLASSKRPIPNESNQVVGLFTSSNSNSPLIINRRSQNNYSTPDRLDLLGNLDLLNTLASNEKSSFIQRNDSNNQAIGKVAWNILDEASKYQSSNGSIFDSTKNPKNSTTTTTTTTTQLHANSPIEVSPPTRYQSNTKRIPSVSTLQTNQLQPVLWPRHPPIVQNSTDANNHLTQPEHYSASLINVTGPLTLPLSASESMEADAARLGIPATLVNRLAGQPVGQPNQLEVKNERVDGQVDSMGRSTSATPTPWRQQQQSAHRNQQATLIPASQTTSLANSSLESARLDGPPSELGPKSGSARPHHHHQQQASGFRSPIQQQTQTQAQHLMGNSNASNWLSNVASNHHVAPSNLMPPNYWASPSGLLTSQTSASSSTSPAPSITRLSTPSPMSTSISSEPNYTTNGFVTGDHLVPGTSTTTDIMSTNYQLADQQPQLNPNPNPNPNLNQNNPTNQPANPARPRFNMTRVEHISAECSNDLIRTVIIFNGTFKGIIYSSGYVRDPDCLYINGTGKTRYDFSIRLNQCGTLGRQEVHSPTGPNDIRRRDQLMWNTLSIQYNPMIEQEWDEHFRVSCEYGSDFWKTISFNPFNVETNTGSPVLFTVNPPQCQMEVRRGHNMVGPRQEAVLGPVTVGDPLTLLIHMKSEKAGYDILVRNCVAHNGGHQKMQLIDSNGCVVNERFISPFRGTYNDQDMKQVTLYAYLKAFRFTGSPVLYLECEIHMCQSACPPQMCYWRQLSKRSTDYAQMSTNETDFLLDLEPDGSRTTTTTTTRFDEGEFNIWSDAGADAHSSESSEKLPARQGRHMRLEESARDQGQLQTNASKPIATPTISDSVSLFQALEVRQEHDADSFASGSYDLHPRKESSTIDHQTAHLICYRQAELLAYLFGLVSIILVAVSVSIGCCWRVSQLRKRRKLEDESVLKQQRQRVFQLAADSSRYSQSANLSQQARFPVKQSIHYHQQHVHNRPQNRSSPSVVSNFN